MNLNIPVNPTLGQYIRYTSAGSDLQKISAITGIDAQKLRSIKPEASSNIITAFETIVSELELKLPYITEVKVSTGIFSRPKKIQLGFLPDLNLVTVAEWADLMKLSENADANALKIASIMFRPVTERLFSFYRIAEYNSDEIDEYIPLS